MGYSRVFADLIHLSRTSGFPLSGFFLCLAILGIAVRDKKEAPWIQPYFYAHF